jgi:hypothetical protein
VLIATRYTMSRKRPALRIPSPLPPHISTIPCPFAPPARPRRPSAAASWNRSIAAQLSAALRAQLGVGVDVLNPQQPSTLYPAAGGMGTKANAAPNVAATTSMMSGKVRSLFTFVPSFLRGS